MTTVDSIYAQIMEMIKPLSQEEAVEVLEDIASRCELEAAAIEEEIDDD